MSIELKQIVYNLEDYGGSGGLISTNKNNHNELIYSMVYQNRENDSTETTLVGDLGLTDYMENRIDIFDKNILANYTNVKKIGIQAPPGTKFTFSESVNFLSCWRILFPVIPSICMSERKKGSFSL